MSNPTMSDERRHTTIFYTIVNHRKTMMKMVIDQGSTKRQHYKCCCTIRCETLSHESRTSPHPFKVAWLNKTNIRVTYKCKVPIQIGSYKDEILCDVLPMDVAHILSGRPWLYTLNVSHHGRDNTYTGRYHHKDITLTPCQPKELLPSPSPKFYPLRPCIAHPTVHPPLKDTISLIHHD